MKKVLLPMMAGFMFFAGDCFAMDPLPDDANMPKSLFGMRTLLRKVHAQGEGFANLDIAVLDNVQGRLLDDDEIASEVRQKLMSLFSSLTLKFPFNKGTNAAYSKHVAVNAARDINLVDSLGKFMDAYGRGTEGVRNGRNAIANIDFSNPTQDSICSLYSEFCSKIGNSDKEVASSFNIAAKTTKVSKANRSIHELVNGMTLCNLKDKACLEAINAVYKAVYGAPVVADEQDCLWMGFLALVEMAERGTLSGGHLKDGENQAGPLGYTPEIVERIKEILPELR